MRVPNKNEPNDPSDGASGTRSRLPGAGQGVWGLYIALVVEMTTKSYLSRLVRNRNRRHRLHDFRGYPGNHDLHGSLLDLHDPHAQMQLLQAEGKALPAEFHPSPIVRLQWTQH